MIRPWSFLGRIAVMFVIFGVAAGLSWFSLTPAPVLGYYGTLLALAVTYKVIRLVIAGIMGVVFRMETATDLLVMVVVADLITMAAVFFLLTFGGGTVAIVGSGIWMIIRMVVFFVAVVAANIVSFNSD